MKPVPITVMDVLGAPATIELGETDEMTGVVGGGATLRLADGEVPPPGRQIGYRDGKVFLR